jgi:hypothetical protein
VKRVALALLAAIVVALFSLAGPDASGTPMPTPGVGQNEYTLLDRLPDQGSPRANWAQNSSVLREEMSRGVPIRLASVDPVTGARINSTGFLRAERNLLENRGWSYDPKTTLWSPGG